MKYDKELRERLEIEKDEKYAKFHSSLIPNSEVLGVRIPKLREIAKEFSKYDDFLKNVSLNSYENISVACYYIGLKAKDFKELKSYLDFILPYVDNWAICDTFVSSLKIFKKKNAKEFLPVIYKLLDSKNYFEVRFAIVVLLSYYISEDEIQTIFSKMLPLQDRNYYIDMAIAWFVSVAFVRVREQTLNFLKSKVLNKQVQNKSISKICDSFRVSQEDKFLVKSFKI